MHIREIAHPVKVFDGATQYSVGSRIMDIDFPYLQIDSVHFYGDSLFVPSWLTNTSVNNIPVYVPNLEYKDIINIDSRSIKAFMIEDFIKIDKFFDNNPDLLEKIFIDFPRKKFIQTLTRGKEILSLENTIRKSHIEEQKELDRATY